MMVKERISSRPLGRHVGHWKCDSTNKSMNWVSTSMANIPHRWQQDINVMLEKKKVNFRADKLRSIPLYDADFNLNNKYTGRDMMRKAEETKSWPKNSMGVGKEKQPFIIH